MSELLKLPLTEEKRKMPSIIHRRDPFLPELMLLPIKPAPGKRTKGALHASRKARANRRKALKKGR